jgi:hypothetical protein
MKLIPNLLLNTDSDAEKKVFKILERTELDGQWTAYHSLNLGKHAYKRWAEIDFLLVGTKGIFVLEVKGGGVKMEDGIWYSRNRRGVTHRLNESPYQQAMSSMYALSELLEKKEDVPHLEKNFFGWGVIFPDLRDWDHTSPEHPREVVADLSDMHDPESFGLYLERLIEYWTSKNWRTVTLSGSELVSLRKAIRPDVDRYPAMTLQISKVEERLLALTHEQYERLDIIEANRQTIVSGGAGTGKTFLVMQLARRELASGRSPLVIVSNPVLAAWLRKMEPDRRIGIESFRSDFVARDQCDVLLVDEGQDLLNLEDIVVLSGCLKGGLDNGRWHWFMDQNNQAGITGTYDPEALQLLQGKVGVTRVPLRQNVRNTKAIADAVRAWTSADIGTPELAGYGEAPTVKKVENEPELAEEVEKVLTDLLNKEVDPRDIGIVYPSSASMTLFESMSRKVRRKLSPLTPATVKADLGHKIIYGSTKDFKGLERPVMLNVGFDDASFVEEEVAQLYVATTRANYKLYLFVGPKLFDAFMRLGIGPHEG